MNTATITLVILSCGQVPASNFSSSPGSRFNSPPVISELTNETSPALRISDSAAPTNYTAPAQIQSPTLGNSQRAPATSEINPHVRQSREADRSRAAIDLAQELCGEATDSAGVEGTDVSLLQLMNRLEDPGLRKRAVQAYWQLVSATAEWNYAQEELRTISSFAQPATRGEQSLLQAQQARAATQQAEAELSLLERQESLAEVMAMPAAELPRPIDVPFIGVYRTNLDTIFAGADTPRRLRQIDRALPRQLDVIMRRAESIVATEQAIGELAQSYQQGTGGLQNLLTSLQELSQQRRSFVGDVLSYNQDIAEYSLAVVGPTTTPEALVGTLILRDPTAQPAMLADSRVRPASAESPTQAQAAAGDDQLSPLAQPTTSQPPSRFDAGLQSPSILRRVIVDHQ